MKYFQEIKKERKKEDLCRLPSPAFSGRPDLHEHQITLAVPLSLKTSKMEHSLLPGDLLKTLHYFPDENAFFQLSS